MSDTFTIQELKEQVNERLEELKRSDLTLADGWTTSPHYGEGYKSGQLALLLELEEALSEV